MDEDKEKADVSWADAADAVGLAECKWFRGVQFLSAFEAKAADGAVIEIEGQFDAFQLLEFLDLPRFALEVPGVADAIKDLFFDRSGFGFEG